MELVCKYQGDFLVIRYGRDGKIILPAAVVPQLYEQMGKAINVRKRIHEFEVAKINADKMITELKSSKEWQDTNERV